MGRIWTFLNKIFYTDTLWPRSRTATEGREARLSVNRFSGSVRIKNFIATTDKRSDVW